MVVVMFYTTTSSTELLVVNSFFSKGNEETPGNLEPVPPLKLL